jgi:hypothetical protein
MFSGWKKLQRIASQPLWLSNKHPFARPQESQPSADVQQRGDCSADDGSADGFSSGCSALILYFTWCINFCAFHFTQLPLGPVLQNTPSTCNEH